MAKQKAKITYCEDFQGKEGYIIWLSNEKNEYDFSSFFPLVKRENATENEECNFIHFSIINKIGELKHLGYEIII